MSEENVEMVRRGYEALSQGDIEAMLADFAPEFEYVSAGVVPGLTGVYRGPEEFKRRFIEGFWGEFEDTHWEINEIIDAGDLVLASVTVTARGQQSGAESSWSFFHLWTFRERKCIRQQGFLSRAEALEAAGLEE